MPDFDQGRIEHLEEELAVARPDAGVSRLAGLEMLADLYLKADSYVPALETIERLLALPEARTLSTERRVVLESRAVACRIAQGDCRTALAQCRELIGREREITSMPLRARIHLQCAEALFRLGRIEECATSATRCLDLADACTDLTFSAHALNMLGRAAYRAGDLQDSRDAYEQALALYRRLGDEVASAHVRNNLGLVHKNLCEWDAAIAHLNVALEIFRRTGHFAEVANPLMNLGIVYQKSGDWTRAAECYREARRIYLQVADQLRLSVVALGLGNLARLERRFTESEALLQEALERAREHGARREEVLAVEFLGELDVDRERPEAALSRYDEGLALARRIAAEGDLVVEIERRRAEALCELGRLDEAESACERARQLARRTEDRLEHAVAHRVAGSIAMARGRRGEALESWRLAESLLEGCRERLELGRTLLLLSTHSEDAAEARRSAYRAATLFSGLSTHHWLDRAEARLQEVIGSGADAPAVRPGSLMGRRHRAPGLVACSQGMRRVEALARRAATTELSVLITGETGTGKELIARTIHSLSSRSSRPFLAVNCGALRADLALSQLFGHRKGAFTGAHAEGVGLVEAAHTGTLFLDEVGELPGDVQVTLLRFLESGEYLRLGETQVRRAEVRLIAATNRDLYDEHEANPFRRDLLFRINEIEIRLPALRERADDIVPLARHFLAFYGGLDGPRLSGDAEAVLTSHAWPGNVRELENVMKRVGALYAGESEVDASVILPFLGQPRSGATEPVERPGDAEERAAILAAYAEARGNKSRVAEILGVSRKTLYARIKRLGLDLS